MIGDSNVLPTILGLLVIGGPALIAAFLCIMAAEGTAFGPPVTPVTVVPPVEPKPESPKPVE